MADKVEYMVTTDNIFEDLGLSNPEELQAKALLGLQIIRLLKGKNLKQKEISSLLGIKQSEVSHLMNGHACRFSMDKLLDFLKRLDQKVKIEISPHKQGEPFQEIQASF